MKPISSRAMALLFGGCFTLSLSACDMLGIDDPFATKRPEQQVVGARHAPILNPDTVPPNPQMMGYVHGTAPPQIQPIQEGISPEYYDNSKVLNPNSNASTAAPTKSNAAPQSAATNPFDYYDAGGNPATPQTPGLSNGTGRFVNNNQSDLSQPVVPEQPAADGLGQLFNGEVRKPIPGNADLSETQATAPLPPEVAATPAQTQTTQTPSSADSGSYPSLSTVPPTPERFKVLKEEKQEDMQDLQASHDTAGLEKQQLDAEPSGQAPPAESLTPLTPAAVAPATAPANPPATPPTSFLPSPLVLESQPVSSSPPPSNAATSSSVPALPSPDVLQNTPMLPPSNALGQPSDNPSAQ